MLPYNVVLKVANKIILLIHESFDENLCRESFKKFFTLRLSLVLGKSLQFILIIKISQRKENNFKF